MFLFRVGGLERGLPGRVLPIAASLECVGEGVSGARTQEVIQGCGAACLWVSHDPSQPGRVGGSILDLPSGRESVVTPA